MMNVDKPYVPYWSRNVTPEQWRERLMTLESPVREAAARIIWWETASLRLVADRTDIFDDLIKFGADVPDDDLQQALIKIGVPEKFAMRRIAPLKPRPPRRRVNE